MTQDQGTVESDQGQVDSAKLNLVYCRLPLQLPAVSGSGWSTTNSGRIQINLKPLDQRKDNASDVIRRLQPTLAKVAGITLFMQPVQVQ